MNGWSAAVAEVQGLYGPFAFPERLLQQIWQRREFDLTQARTIDGRKVEVRRPGRWNGLGGPDFQDARLRIGEVEVTGDVELHLRAEDWVAHGHAKDPAYDRVCLHVVLFPPAAGAVTRGGRGEELPVLVLLPLLWHDLEEYAADAAVERLASRPAGRALEVLGALANNERRAVLARHAEQRWRAKVHFARLRLQRLGWREACHQTALEILGYRFNRAPMLRIASAWPLAAWERSGVEPDVIFATEAEHWHYAGVRPANQPRHRLRQYAAWVRARPDWPTRLEHGRGDLPPEARLARSDATATVRKQLRLAQVRAAWSEAICGGAIGGTRFDNLMCDGFLPLLAAVQEAVSWQQVWHHWQVGDEPRSLVVTLRELAVFAGRERPACHGAVQGLLGWWLEEDRIEIGAADLAGEKSPEE